MKKNLFFAIAIMATMLFTSCYQVCYENPLPPDRSGGQTVFTGTVGDFSTRITTDELGQSQWSPGDAIGIFALPTGGTFAGSTLTANNHRFFTNVTSGIFTPAIPTADNQIILPPTGNFDFIAYHPHTTPLTGNVLSVNVATTTNPSAALDLLWTRAINPVNTPVVPLAFERRMSQIRVYVRAAQPTTTLPLAGLKAEIDGVLVNATMNLEDGAVTPSTAGTLNATTIVTVSGGYDIALTPWLFVPPQTLNDVYVTLKTSEREWEDIPIPSPTLLPGLRYNIVIYVNADGSRTVVIQNPTNIPGWGDGGNIYVPGEHPPTPPPPTFSVSATAVSLAAAGQTVQIDVAAEVGLDWDVLEQAGQTWLTVNTGGSGPGDFDIIAQPNPNGWVRAAYVTITPDDIELDPITIKVSQAGTDGLLFPGSNFSDWSAFLGAFPIGSPAAGVTEMIGGGENGETVLRFYPTAGITATANLFAAVLPQYFFAGASTISFDLYGVSTVRSISAVLLAATSPTTNGVIQGSFDLGTVADQDIADIPFTSGNPSYTGSIDTDSNWINVTLDLSTVPANILANVNRFQIRAGGATGALGGPATYDIRIANITIQ